jgi:hypothetical protein
MKKRGKFTAPKKHTALYIATAVAWILAIAIIAGGHLLSKKEAPGNSGTANSNQEQSSQTPDSAPKWETGFVSTLNTQAQYCDAKGTPLGTLIRGTQVEYTLQSDGKPLIRLDGTEGYLNEDASVVTDAADIIPAHTLYVRSAVNLRDAQGKLLPGFAHKGSAVSVTGCDYLYEDGNVHMYRVSLGNEVGYIMPWYLADNETDALANYDNGSYTVHANRGNRYGGGGAADLDYFPREKNPIEGNEMPEECRTLYIVAWRLNEVDAYLEIAENSGINAFVVDIMDGNSIGYPSAVMQQYSPSAASAALNTTEEYKAAIQKLKDAGYYVIGRITTFNDSYFIQDHPEYAITDTNGNPLRLSGGYWPTAYNRTAWQYKVDLAVEAVELMGFHEIQFDYVRFPDLTSSYEEAGIIDFHNTYGESKAQAIQRFLMYATDIIHEHGAYVSADVYGESAYTYVTAYGQYWSAISNVVDVISGMPYPDHFAANGTWLPWEHPYDTLYNWGQNVMVRQGETATPAAVRTWIQAYNAIREPYNSYGPQEVAAQISGLRDAGCTGGYMTWNSGSSLDKYTWLIPAFEPPEDK